MEILTELQRWACASKITLAVVFTDVVGSTALNRKLGNKGWHEVFSQHTERVEELLSQYDCQKIKDTGDGFMIVFRTAIDALNFSIALYIDTGHPDINIRAGIHVGAVQIKKDDIQGVMVNLTSRII